EKLDRQRQPRCRENLFVNLREDFLGGEIGGDPLAQDPEKVGLFDIFFAVEGGGGHVAHFSVQAECLHYEAARVGCGKASTMLRRTAPSGVASPTATSKTKPPMRSTS